jgi:RNA polymerase-interacting CarD/CdnL/TRCF family regulator
MLSPNFKVGAPVIHWIYGMGEVVRLERKYLPGQAQFYYVVQVKDLTIWVPLDHELTNRLRNPTPAEEFKHLFAILKSPGRELSKDRYERRTALLDERKNATAEANCRIIRDLFDYMQESKLNDYDMTILKLTLDSLLCEWAFSLSVTRQQAELELRHLLKKSKSPGPVSPMPLQFFQA